MAKQYWIRIEGDVGGPYPVSKIRKMAEKGKILHTAEISADGKKYHPISAVRGLPPIKMDEEEAEALSLEAASPDETSGESTKVPTTESDSSKSFRVFVSYRRDTGAAIASLVKEKLERAGYSVFIDIEGLEEGSFVDALRNVIEECTDFVPIITEGFFDRCHDESDHVRRELKLAMELEKNIVPLLVAETPFPSDVPDDLTGIATYNGVRYTHDFLPDCMEKLRRMLKSGRIGLDRLDSEELAPKLVVVITGIVLVLMPANSFYVSLASGGGFSGLINSLSFLFMSLFRVPIYAMMFAVPVLGALFGASVAFKRDSNKLYCGREWIAFWVLYVPTISLISLIAGTVGTSVASLILPASVYFVQSIVGTVSAFVAVGFFLKLLFDKKWWRMVLRLVPTGS